MGSARNPYTEAALQYLIWAVEELEKAGDDKAARHARSAIDALQTGSSVSQSVRVIIRRPQAPASSRVTPDS